MKGSNPRNHHRIPGSHWAAIITACGLLTACNLGQNTPTLVDDPAAQAAPDDQGGDTSLTPQAVPEQIATATPGIVLPPTNTPPPAALPNEQLGPISIDNADNLRTQTPVTVRVQRGTQVSTVTCSVVRSDTGQSTALPTPTSRAVDDNIAEDSYTFTPEQAGTYAINCSGLAQTASGQRPVTASSNSFEVEAKG